MTTESPVMVTADVAVNKASNHDKLPVFAKGSFSKTVPIIIKLKKPKASKLGGLRLIRLCFLLISSFLDKRIVATNYKKRIENCLNISTGPSRIKISFSCKIVPGAISYST